MLKDLKILNGEMTLKFDSLNTVYTINMLEDDSELKFEYEIDEDNHISIFDNKLDSDENIVVITVYNDEKMMSYYLKVYQKMTTTMNKNVNNMTSLGIEAKKEVPSYAVSSIGAVCFLTILLFFTLLFKKNKKC